MYLPESLLPYRPYVAFELRDAQDRLRAVPPQRAVAIAAHLRSAACEKAKAESGHQFPGGAGRYVAGHAQNSRDAFERFSYLPLPTVRMGGYADGKIRRVLIAEPFGSTGEHVRWAARVLRDVPLTDRSGTTVAWLVPARRRDHVVRCYVGPGREWFTVTPVVLPGHDDHKPAKRRKLLAKAIRQAGIPLAAIEDLIARNAPFWPGGLHPTCYHRPDYLQHYPLCHVYVRFREEVRGPIAVGAGRHCGLGVFATGLERALRDEAVEQRGD